MFRSIVRPVRVLRFSKTVSFPQSSSSFIPGNRHECSLARAPAGWDRWQLLLEQIRSATAMPIRPAEHQLRCENIEKIILLPWRLSKRENPVLRDRPACRIEKSLTIGTETTNQEPRNAGTRKRVVR